jgi:hypothetical protein
MQLRGSFAEFTLSPFASLRAVRERRANGLRMTSGGIVMTACATPIISHT